jgi:hypothetical protein
MMMMMISRRRTRRRRDDGDETPAFDIERPRENPRRSTTIDVFASRPRAFDAYVSH